MLDVAAGTGQTFAAVVAANPHGLTLGADVSSGMLRRSRRRVALLSGAHELLVADARRLPLRDGSVDLALCTYLFDLLPDSDFTTVLGELHRVLRRDGRCVITNMTVAQYRRHDLFRHVYRLRPTLMGGCRLDDARRAAPGPRVRRPQPPLPRAVGLPVGDHRGGSSPHACVSGSGLPAPTPVDPMIASLPAKSSSPPPVAAATSNTSRTMLRLAHRRVG